MSSDEKLMPPDVAPIYIDILVAQRCDCISCKAVIVKGDVLMAQKLKGNGFSFVFCKACGDAALNSMRERVLAGEFD